MISIAETKAVEEKMPIGRRKLLITTDEALRHLQPLVGQRQAHHGSAAQGGAPAAAAMSATSSAAAAMAPSSSDIPMPKKRKAAADMNDALRFATRAL